MRACFALALAATTVPALAQEGPPFSAAATEACLAAAVEPEGCIGLSADACMNTPDGSSTVGMGFCLGREFDYWDHRLNTAYAALLQLEEALDAEMKEIGASVPSTAEALRTMQRAWIPYRDASCDYERSQWGGGTGGGPASAECMMRLTGQQALALEGLLADKRRQ